MRIKEVNGIREHFHLDLERKFFFSGKIKKS